MNNYMPVAKLNLLCLSLLATAPSATQAERLTIKLAASSNAVFVEQRVPVDAIISNVSHGGVFDHYSQSIKWGPIDTNRTRELAFTFTESGQSEALPTFTSPPGLALSEISLSTDTDNDGIPDEDEESTGSNPEDPTDATDDTDGDGIHDLAEYYIGSDPTNPESPRLRIEYVDAIPSIVVIGIQRSAPVFLEHSASLDTSIWSQVPFSEVATSETGVNVIGVADLIPNDRRATRYFRLRIETVAP